MAGTVNNTTVIKDAEQKSLVLERVFQASPSRVWQAWTDPQQFTQWWGPRGWQTEVKDADVRVGGRMVYGMKCVDEAQGEWFGQTSWGMMEFTAVDEPNSLEYVDYFSDENGVANDAMPSSTIHLEFVEQDGGTLLRSTTVFGTAEGYEQVIAMGVVEGATETWDRLAELVQS